jgi:hypothetical protein
MTDSKSSGVLTGKLTVTLKCGKDLAEKDVGKQDPYCKIHIGSDSRGEKYKSKVHKKGGKTPVWDQSFIFNLKGVKVAEVFHLTCWDEDMMSDDMIGRADVPLSHLLIKRGPKPFDIQLVDKDNFKKIAGYINMVTEFDGTGAPPAESETKTETKLEPPKETPRPTTPTPTTAPAPTPVSTPTPTYVQPTGPSQPQSYPSYGQPHSHPQPAYSFGQPQPVMQQPVLIQQPTYPATFTQPPVFTAQPSYPIGFQPTLVQPVYTQPMVVQQQPTYYQQPTLYQQPTQVQPAFYQQPTQWGGQPGYPAYR